jgi:NAD-dependent DNA ligase
MEPSEALITAITELPSWSRDSAASFVRKLPEFKEFLAKVGVVPVPIPVPVPVPNPVQAPALAPVDGTCKGIVALFTGFRSKELEETIVREGGEVADSFSKKVNVLIVKDSSVNNEKVKKAKAAGIPVLTPDEFKRIQRL